MKKIWSGRALIPKCKLAQLIKWTYFPGMAQPVGPKSLAQASPKGSRIEWAIWLGTGLSRVQLLKSKLDVNFIEQFLKSVLKI